MQFKPIIQEFNNNIFNTDKSSEHDHPNILQMDNSVSRPFENQQPDEPIPLTPQMKHSSDKEEYHEPKLLL